MRLRTKLAALAALVALAGSAASVALLYRVVAGTLEDAAREEQLGVVREAVQEVDRLLAERVADLQVAASLPDFADLLAARPPAAALVAEV